MEFLSLGGDSFAEKVVTCNLPRLLISAICQHVSPTLYHGLQHKGIGFERLQQKPHFTTHGVAECPCYGSASILTWWHYLQISRSKSEQVSQKSCYRIHFTIHFLTQCTWPPPLVVLTTCLNIYSKKRCIPASGTPCPLKPWHQLASWSVHHAFGISTFPYISYDLPWQGIWYPFGLLINRMIL